MRNRTVSPDLLKAWEEDIEAIRQEMLEADAELMAVTVEHLGLVSADLKYERYELTGPDVQFFKRTR